MIKLNIYTRSKCTDKATRTHVMYPLTVSYYHTQDTFIFTGPAHLLSLIFVPMHIFTYLLTKIEIRYQKTSLFPLETLQRVTSSCPMLKSLDINYIYFESEMVDVSIFSSDVKKVCSALESNICTLSLQVSQYSRIDIVLLLFLNSPEVSLQDLSLNWCCATYNELQTVVSSIDNVPILERVPLKIRGSCQFTYDTLSQLQHYMTTSLTIDLGEYRDTPSAEFNIITSNYPMLQMLQVNVLNSTWIIFSSQQANYHTLQLFHDDADSETEQRAQGLPEPMILYGETVCEFTIHYNKQESTYELKMMPKDAKGVQFDIIDKYEH